MIRFTKYIWLYIVISSLVLIPGIYSLVRFGVKPSVDFTGGTLLEMKLDATTTQEQIRAMVETQALPGFSMQKTGDDIYIFRMGLASEESVAAFEQAIAKRIGKTPEVLRKDSVGPILGSELLFKSIAAAVCAIIAILLYVAYAFKNIKTGVSAIIALVHDVLVVFGSFSLLGHFLGVEVDTLFMTAFLTTMSFSVHDTIVIFDRIREYQKKEPRADLKDVINIALTETMGRSIVNSFTIIFMLLALVLMGGETVRWFAVALLIGTITGTYSSPFVATPILYMWSTIGKKKT